MNDKQIKAQVLLKWHTDGTMDVEGIPAQDTVDFGLILMELSRQIITEGRRREKEKKAPRIEIPDFKPPGGDPRAN